MTAWHERLVQVMNENGNKPGRLTKIAGFSGPTAKKWCDGDVKEPSAFHIDKICSHYGINSHWLLTGFPPKHSPSARETDTFITIPRYDVAAAMGIGITQPDTETVAEIVRVNKTYLARKSSFTSPANLAIITAAGDSMTPTFADGDLLIVDTGVNEVHMDAVYVLSRDGELFIKRIMRRPGKTLRVISDNEKYRDHHYDITPDNSGDFKIHGRVLLAWNARFM